MEAICTVKLWSFILLIVVCVHHRSRYGEHWVNGRIGNSAVAAWGMSDQELATDAFLSSTSSLSL